MAISVDISFATSSFLLQVWTTWVRENDIQKLLEKKQWHKFLFFI